MAVALSGLSAIEDLRTVGGFPLRPLASRTGKPSLPRLDALCVDGPQRRANQPMQHEGVLLSPDVDESPRAGVFTVRQQQLLIVHFHDVSVALQ